MEKEQKDTFKHIIDPMPVLLNNLNNKAVFQRDEIGMGQIIVPQKGVYVLFENDRPIYVGRSDNIKTTIERSL